MKRIVLIYIGINLLVNGVSQAQIAGEHYPVQPVPFNQVKLQDNFWYSRVITNQRITIPIAIQKSEETGRVDNFKIAAGLMDGNFKTEYPFDDSDIFKILEGASYSIQVLPNPELEAKMDELIQYVGEAQEEDGYLFTVRTINGPNGHSWIGKSRWEKTHELSHELYNLGHLFEAAAAHYMATGKRSLLDIAIKAANLIDKDFGPGKLQSVPGHQEVELGLVKLYNVTGERRYLNLAKYFLDNRGQEGIGLHREYDQSHLPVVEQREAVGHSVRATYMWSGMADVAALTDDLSYIKAMETLWHDVVYRKLYLTGGIGAIGSHEGFGGPFELPNMSAYSETCAAIGNIFWNHRMFLMTGDSKYIDVLELSLYNTVLSGIAMSGDKFFYPNPLESQGQHQRSEWFGCACCPSNEARFIPSMPNYIYAQKGDDLYVNLYVASETDFAVGGKSIRMTQQGNMPWSGAMQILINPEKPVYANIKLRIPGWAKNQLIPSDLYSYASLSDRQVGIKVNGKTVSYSNDELVCTKGYLTVNRKWRKGDVIEVDLPLDVNRVISHPAVLENKGKVALMRGPLVYAAEWPDFEDDYILDVLVDKQAAFRSHYEPDFLDGMVTIQGEVKGVKRDEDGLYTLYPRGFKAIPYYAWAHRGAGQMTVWMASEVDKARPKPIPTISTTSKVSCSINSRTLFAINNQLVPTSSADRSNLYLHWWPRVNTTEWVQYDFEKPQAISSSTVYWFDDAPWGGCRIPKEWRILYKQGESWIPVDVEEQSDLEKDTSNHIRFKPVTTSAVRMEIILPENHSTGIHEWSVE